MENLDVVNLPISCTMFVLAAVKLSVTTTKEVILPFHRAIRIIIMFKGIKRLQVKHLFSEVVCNVKGQGVLKHVKMLITLTPHTLFQGWEKGYPWFIGVVWLWIQDLTFSSVRKQFML